MTLVKADWPVEKLRAGLRPTGCLAKDVVAPERGVKRVGRWRCAAANLIPCVPPYLAGDE